MRNLLTAKKVFKSPPKSPLTGTLAMIAVATTLAFAAQPANAGIFDLLTDAHDAITGHVNDINERLNHDDEYIDGMVITSNSFRRDDVGRDGIHWANGTVTLERHGDSLYIQLGGDFESGPAPDLHIYTANTKVVDEGTFYKADATELSKLSSGSGAQYYRFEPTSEQDLENLEVIIWCKRFGAFIAATTLNGDK